MAFAEREREFLLTTTPANTVTNYDSAITLLPAYYADYLQATVLQSKIVSNHEI